MSKQTKVKISKLCLEIDGKKIELTMKQARELTEVLNDTFGKSETVFRDRWHYPHYHQPYWSNGVLGGVLTTTTDLNANVNAHSDTTDTVLTSTAEWQGQIDAGLITLTAQ